jgi:predicted O-methyltransferase YrrM
VSRTLDETLALIDGVEGWLSPDQVGRLYASAAVTQAGDQVVDIGSFRGRSTIVLACAAPDGVGVVAIDPHAGNDRGPEEISGFEAEAASDHEVFNANLVAAGIADRVRHVREFSAAAHDSVDGPIAVLFIDGAHRYTPARADIREWGRRVAPGGTLLIHDSFSSVGVTLAIVRELTFGARFRYAGRSRSLAEYRADLEGGRAVNAVRQIAQLPWFVKNVTIKVLLKLHLGGILRRLTSREPCATINQWRMSVNVLMNHRRHSGQSASYRISGRGRCLRPSAAADYGCHSLCGWESLHAAPPTGLCRSW